MLRKRFKIHDLHTLQEKENIFANEITFANRKALKENRERVSRENFKIKIKYYMCLFNVSAFFIKKIEFQMRLNQKTKFHYSQ